MARNLAWPRLSAQACNTARKCLVARRIRHAMDSAMMPVHAVPSGHATEQALESGGAVATARPMPVAAQKPHIVHRRKHSGRHQPLRFSADVSLPRQSQTATQHRPTSRSGISPALGELAANVISPIRRTATQHPPFGGAEHGVHGDDSIDVHMAHATGTGSLCSLGQCGHALGTLRIGWQVSSLSD